MGKEYVIDSLKIFDFNNLSSPERDYTYSVSVCNDPSFSLENEEDASWTYIGTTPKGLSTCITDFSLKEKCVARYVKLHDLKVFGATSFAMTELEAYGIDAEDIDSVKNYATLQLQSYYSDIELSESEQTSKDRIVEDAISSIQNQEDVNMILSQLNQAYKDIDDVIDISKYRHACLLDINQYKNQEGLFSKEDALLQKEKLQIAIEELSQCSDKSVMDKIVEDYKHIIDTFKVIVNLALNKNAYASSIEANSVRASLAVDGNTTARESRWGSAKGNGPHWIYVDLGEEKDIRTVKVFWENRKATQYSIQISHDASNWETVQGFTSRPHSLEEYFILTQTKTTRYVRLYIDEFTEEDPDGGIKYNTISIYELEVYEYKIQD